MVKTSTAVPLLHQGQESAVSGDHTADFLVSPKGHVNMQHLPQQVWGGLGCVSNKLPGISSDYALSNEGLGLPQEAFSLPILPQPSASSITLNY